MWNNLEYVFILFDEVVHVTANATMRALLYQTQNMTYIH